MLKGKIQNLFSGEAGNVFRGMLTLFMGTGLARIIGIASIPILTRIYSPEDFGVLALYSSFISILAPILTLRYVQAIPLPKTDLMAFHLFILSFTLIFLGSFFTITLLAIFGQTILGWFNMEALMPWRWLIVVGAAGTALYELFSLWATRKRQYKVIARTQFTQSLIGNIAKILMGLLNIKPAGLIIGQFLSQSAGITSFIKSSLGDFKKNISSIKKSNFFFTARYFQDFVWYRLPSQFLMLLSVQAPIMMMAALYGGDVTGQLSLAIMALSLPVGLLGRAIGRAYYAEVAAIGKNDPQKIYRITVEVQKKLFLLGIPATLSVFFLAEPAFRLFFGTKWAVAGQYASILSPYMLLQFSSSPLVQVLNVIGSQLSFLMLNIIRAIGLLLLYLTFLFLKITPIKLLYSLSILLSVYYLWQTIFIMRLLIKMRN